MSKVNEFVAPLDGSVKSRVKTMLLFDEGVRDDVQMLYIMYLTSFHNIDRNKETLNSFFTKIINKEIPSLEYVARCKRKLQNRIPELRGAKWGGEV